MAEPTKTDVEEAIGRLRKFLSWMTHEQFEWALSAAEKERREDVRTILEAYAKRDAEVMEAVRLMKPFVRYGFNEADGWGDYDALHLFADEPLVEIDRFTVKQFRALSTYVTKHEAEDVR